MIALSEADQSLAVVLDKSEKRRFGLKGNGFSNYGFQVC